MKSFKLIILSMFMFACVCYGQENEKPIKVPSFIIFNKFTNKDSYKLIRWVSWSEEQKLKIFLFTQEQGKRFDNLQNEVDQKIQKLKEELKTDLDKNNFDEKKKTIELMGNAQSEIKEKIQKMIETLLTDDQKKEFANKNKSAELMKAELEKNLTEFDEKTKQLKGAPFNQNLYDMLNTTKFFHFPEIWAITRTPLTEDDKNILMEAIGKLLQIEQGYHLASGKNTEDLNITNGYCLFDFNMKKDSGTAFLNNEIKKFSKPNQDIFDDLVGHYNNQKKALMTTYQKYGEKTKFEIPMTPPKIIDDPTNKTK